MSTVPYTTDTSPEAEAVLLECIRRMTPEDRLRRACAMSQQVKQMAFDAIRRRHPEHTDAEVRLLFIELAYGVELANNLRRWTKEQVS